jgi:hypothetical protein
MDHDNPAEQSTMNVNDWQDEEAPDGEEVLPKSAVAPDMRFTESEGYSNIVHQSQLLVLSLPSQHHHSLNSVHSHQHHCYSPLHSNLDVLKDDTTVLGRSSRLQKKEYVKKLKDLMETLRSERSEEMRQRCIAVQQTANLENKRRKVISTFLKYHSSYETDQSKWSTIVEDTFLLKQPVTPFRSSRGAEIEKVSSYKRAKKKFDFLI